MKKQRPVNLDLTTISMPPSAKASILHRVTGVAMFFALCFVLWAWATSLSSKEGFDLVVNVMNSFLAQFIAFGTLSVLAYHLVGGVRHLFMDMGYGEELKSGNSSAVFVIVLWVILTLLAGAWIWL